MCVQNSKKKILSTEQQELTKLLTIKYKPDSHLGIYLYSNW